MDALEQPSTTSLGSLTKDFEQFQGAFEKALSQGKQIPQGPSEIRGTP